MNEPISASAISTSAISDPAAGSRTNSDPAISGPATGSGTNSNPAISDPAADSGTKGRPDRRVRRTKALLQRGLIRLMSEKDIKDISVRELSDLADINRGTFYLHYNDVYDMLAQLEDELFCEFHSILDRTLNPKSGVLSHGTAIREIFSFLERHRDLAQVMMGRHGDLAFVNRMKNLVKDRIYSILSSKQAADSYPYIESFVVSGYIGVIEAWLNSPDPPAPEEMESICGRMISGFIKGTADISRNQTGDTYAC